ncbi:MAG: type II secretion system F family protein [Victivallaceae bacterium]|nr:type II secretion system F family protein [Victivallaceae bacterium]
MATFSYLAGKGAEAPRVVDVEADSQSDALAKLRGMKLLPIRFLGENTTGGSSAFTRKKIDVNGFTCELAVLLKSHVPLEKALALIAEGAAEPDQKEFVTSLRQGLHEGKPLSALVREHGRLFPPFYANIIETGEETGCLDVVTGELHKFMEASRELREFIISSSIYPAVILAVCAAVLVLMFTVFVPKFAGVFTQMGRELPGSMKFLIGLSGFFKWAWWLVPLLLVGGWFAARRFLGTARFDYLRGAALIRTPLLGRLVVKLEMCRFLRTLGILAANNVEIIRTVKLSAGAIKHQAIRNSFMDLETRLKSGRKLSAALADNPFLPPGGAAMIRIGEESGETAEMIAGVADRLEEETRRHIKRLLALFEPVVIVILAGIILVVVVAIFVSILEMNAIK